MGPHSLSRERVNTPGAASSFMIECSPNLALIGRAPRDGAAYGDSFFPYDDGWLNARNRNLR
jgi:hypothetical protein